MKPIRICAQCGARVIKSDIKDYPFQCLKCDEDKFTFETEKLAYKEFKKIIN